MLSVPHSGSRTLVEHTGIRAREQGLGGDGQWWHFGKGEIGRTFRRKWLHRHHAHIPIRNPLDVAASWARRLKTGDVRTAMLGCFEEMFEYLEQREEGEDYTFYRMEDLPRLEGVNQSPVENSDHNVRLFQDAVREHVLSKHIHFYWRFYDDL